MIEHPRDAKPPVDEPDAAPEAAEWEPAGGVVKRPPAPAGDDSDEADTTPAS